MVVLSLPEVSGVDNFRGHLKTQTADHADCRLQTVQTVQTEYLFSYLNKSTYNPDIADDRWPQLISSTLSSPVFVYFFSNSRQLSVCFSYGSSIPAKIHGLYLKFTLYIWSSSFTFMIITDSF